MSKIKPILPSLRERKRYLAFEIISKNKISDFSAVSRALWQSFSRFLGELECSKAGIMILAEKYNKELQRGLIRVNNKYVNQLKSALLFMDRIEAAPVVVKSVGVSGMIGKAYKKYF